MGELTNISGKKAVLTWRILLKVDNKYINKEINFNIFEIIYSIF